MTKINNLAFCANCAKITAVFTLASLQNKTHWKGHQHSHYHNQRVQKYSIAIFHGLYGSTSCWKSD